MSTTTEKVHEPRHSTAEPYLACHDCDSIYPWPRLQTGQRAVCSRCGKVMLEAKPDSIRRALTLSLTSLSLFFLANFFPLLTMSIEGRMQETTIFSGVQELYRQDFPIVAGLVLIVSIIAPLLKILGLLYVLLPLHLRHPMPHSTHVFRMVETLGPWAMTEVYMLGILVAIVKLADLATIQPGISLYSFAALILVMTAADASLEPHEVWSLLQRHAYKKEQAETGA